jgi:mannosyltransferase
MLMAFALRVISLDRQPLWWDEGLNAHLAQHSPADLLGEMKATNHADPPVYPLILSGWKALAGSTPFALRFFSVSMGVVAVALTGLVGRWLASKPAAVLAALLVALAPMQVYYAREAKSYAFTVACALLSTYAWGQRLGFADDRSSPRRARWWIVYVLSTAAAVGSHYYLGLLVMWQGLWVAGHTGLAPVRSHSTRRATLSRAGRWILAVGVVALLLAPAALLLFPTTVRGVTGVSRADSLPLHSYLRRIVLEFCAGPDQEGTIAWAASAVLVILGIIGAWSSNKRTLLTWVAVPVGGAYLVQTAFSFSHPRFLLYLTPACYLLVGQGIVALGSRNRPLAALLVVVIVGLWATGLTPIYIAQVDEAEDPRPVVAHIRTQALPDDALVYVYIWQTGYLFSHYPQNELTPYRAYYTPQTVGSELTTIFTSHPRLWLLSYRVAAEDSQNLSATWLEAEAYKVESTWYGNHHLALYLAPDTQTEGVGPEEGAAVFDEQVKLHYPLIDAHLSPGDAIALPLRWRALAAPSEDYQVFIHLGTPGTPPVAQSDGSPKNGLSPTGAWTVGQEVLDRRALVLPGTLADGRYTVTAGLYRLSDGSRLPIDGTDDSDTLTIGHVEVEH